MKTDIYASSMSPCRLFGCSSQYNNSKMDFNTNYEWILSERRNELLQAASTHYIKCIRHGAIVSEDRKCKNTCIWAVEL